MPKMKTRRAAAKRFSATATGKIKMKRSGLRHLLGTRSSSEKRHKTKTAYVHSADRGLVKGMLPYL